MVSGVLLTLLFTLPLAIAADLEQIKQRGVIEIAVYAKFPPFSVNSGGQPEGVDVEIGTALAKKLGLTPNFRVFLADESVEDDFRNQIWKGHYLGGGTADVMMHAPVDPEFAAINDQVRILAPYFEEELVVARGRRLEQAKTMDAFLKDKVGVEQLTLSSYFLLTAFGGGMRESAVHFKSIGDAVGALRQGEVAAVLGPRGEIEGALGKGMDAFHIGPMPMPGLHRTRWDLGMAVKSNHEDLAAAIDAAMSELRDDGTIAQIFNRAGLTYRPPSQDGMSSMGIQASINADTYKGPACR
jgi:ABC-type amino acid transport substrate-binding protein